MATLQTLHDDIHTFFDCASLRLRDANCDFANANRFNRSTKAYIESPLDKPLPPFPSPIDMNLPEVRTPISAQQQHHNSHLSSLANASLGWRQQYADALVHGGWVDNYFEGRDVFFGASNDGYAWSLGRKVLDRADFSSNQPYATSVYECTQIKGRVRGPKAYMKIYMQIPRYCATCDQISSKPLPLPKWISTEITALKCMSQLQGEVSAPRLLAMKTKVQSRRMWVPGGFLAFVVMQRLPGTALDSETFWSLSSHLRNEIRRSFRVTLQKVWQAGVMPRNCAIDKVSWNQLTGKCYIIDLQGAETIQHPLRWWDYEYYRWGLSNTALGAWESSLHSQTATTEMIDRKIKSAISRANLQRLYSPVMPPPHCHELAAANG